jgi:hypothetical protein
VKDFAPVVVRLVEVDQADRRDERVTRLAAAGDARGVLG